MEFYFLIMMCAVGSSKLIFVRHCGLLIHAISNVNSEFNDQFDTYGKLSREQGF